jgi:thioredoxin reductase
MEQYEYVIIGAGPAGLQMGYYLRRAGRNYLIAEANETAGSFFATQPRHRMLLSLNKRFNGFDDADFNMRHDWNSLLTEGDGVPFSEYSNELYPNADDLHRYLKDFAAQHELAIRYGYRVNRVERADGGGFRITGPNGDVLQCQCLIVGTGAQAPYLPPDVEGIEQAEGYEDHDIDPSKYENKRVLVIGRGNSAFEVANHLASHAALIHIAIGNRPIDLAWQTHSVRNLRAVNNTILEMFHVKALHGALGLNIKRINKRSDGTYDVIAHEEVPTWKEPGILELELQYDTVIRCTGFKYTTPEIFSDDTRPETCPKSKYPVLDSSWQSSTPGVYYIGTAMAARDKKSASSFIHGFRYNIRTLHRLLEHERHGAELPSTAFPLETVDQLRELATAVLSRLSTTAALYQQYGFLCDVLKFSRGGCEFYSELPKDYVLERPEFTQDAELLVVTFEYGFQRYPGNVNSLQFITQMDETSSRRCAAFLQPIFRRYENGELVEEDNLGDSLMLRYSRYREASVAQAPRPTDDVELNTVMNIINRVSHTTEDVFSEESLLSKHRFLPWPEGRERDTSGLPTCAETVRPRLT